MPSRAQRAWEDLNDRQQIYLKVIYDADQANEEAHRKEAARTWSSAPAHQWRRLDFNGRYSRIAPALRSHGVYDTGAGATLAVLRDRGLIESETWTGILTDPVYVWITPAGRAAVRAGLSIPPAWRKPEWALSEWLWKNLVVVAAAGPEGLPRGTTRSIGNGLFGDWHLYLSTGQKGRRGNRPYIDGSNYRWVTYDAKVSLNSNETYKKSEPVYYYVLTDEGRAHYTEYLEQYRELYPDVEAPDLQRPDGEQDQEQDGQPEAAD